MRKKYRGDTSVRGIIEADFPGCTPSVVIRRKVLDELGGFDESFPNNEDWDLFHLPQTLPCGPAALSKHLLDFDQLLSFDQLY